MLLFRSDTLNLNIILTYFRLVLQLGYLNFVRKTLQQAVRKLHPIKIVT